MRACEKKSGQIELCLLLPADVPAPRCGKTNIILAFSNAWVKYVRTLTTYHMNSFKISLLGMMPLMFLAAGLFSVVEAQEPIPGGAKKFGDITIPLEVSPSLLKLPAAMQLDPSVAVLKVYVYESQRPLRRVLFSHTKFLQVDVDDKILEGNAKVTIQGLIAEFRGAHLLKETEFSYPGLRAKRFSIRGTGTNTTAYECFRFHDKRSIWWINFIGQRDGDGTADYAKSFMKKVSFIDKD